MSWKKQGVFFEVTKNSDWMHSHAAVPFVLFREGRPNRLFFTTRSQENKSHVAYLDFDNKFNISSVADTPVLSPRNLGSFEEDGVTASYLVEFKGRLLMYYVGWNRGTSVPFKNAIGVAESYDGGETFTPMFRGPIVDRSPVDPFFVAGTCVKPLNGDMLQMWYISCVDWKSVNGKPRHYYHLKHATSKDGFNWDMSGKVVIDFKDEHEYAISQPWVIYEHNMYKMWFSHRAQPTIDKYRIGYAESADGLTWNRDLDPKIDVSEDGWDSGMICYPYVFDMCGGRYMFYNGNEYGKSGIGLAKWE